ncbi:hypothetical protein I600_3264 [Maribacter dokdonensis DSW-8]|nr:hypothetical protein I600_3264 [Maribacter dokdonensis DSW-8]
MTQYVLFLSKVLYIQGCKNDHCQFYFIVQQLIRLFYRNRLILSSSFGIWQFHRWHF